MASLPGYISAEEVVELLQRYKRSSTAPAVKQTQDQKFR